MRLPLPHGQLSTAVLLLLVVYGNVAAEALGREEQRRGAGDELTHAVRKVSQGIRYSLMNIAERFGNLSEGFVICYPLVANTHTHTLSK